MPDRHRRTVLFAGGTALMTALAGCTSSSDDDSDDSDGADDEDAGSSEGGNGGDDGNGGDGGNGGDSGNGGDGDSDGGKSDVDGEEGDINDRLELLEHDWYADGDAGVSGKVENVSDEVLSDVWVEVAFLDADGEQIEEGVDKEAGLEAGATWEFDVEFLGDDPDAVASYEIGTDILD